MSSISDSLSTPSPAPDSPSTPPSMAGDYLRVPDELVTKALRLGLELGDDIEVSELQRLLDCNEAVVLSRSELPEDAKYPYTAYRVREGKVYLNRSITYRPGVECKEKRKKLSGKQPPKPLP